MSEEAEEIADQNQGDNEVSHIELTLMQKKLIKRCKAADLKTEINYYTNIPGEDDFASVVVHFPNARETRRISFTNDEKIIAILKTDFENFVFIGDYVAIANYNDNYIEALIRPLDPMPTSAWKRRLFGRDKDGNLKTSISVEKKANHQLCQIEISPTSEKLKAINRRHIVENGLSLKIVGVPINSHKTALDILKRLSDSVFFQIDIQNDFALTVYRERRYNRASIKRRKATDNELEFPKVEFDSSPLALYWYARSATGMPLLQFLAYYQVIEYYFPSYSQQEAKSKIRTLLKNPAFRLDKDADIGKILNAVSGQGKGHGSERAQLRATINACIDNEELRQFFSENEERETFFTKKQKGLTDLKIPIADSQQDLRNHVADIIYEIRCKIVHTKGDSIETPNELLLPFSKEAELLLHDIDLIKFIAKNTLIAASVPLNL